MVRLFARVVVLGRRIHRKIAKISSSVASGRPSVTDILGLRDTHVPQFSTTASFRGGIRKWSTDALACCLSKFEVVFFFQQLQLRRCSVKDDRVREDSCTEDGPRAVGDRAKETKIRARDDVVPSC